MNLESRLEEYRPILVPLRAIMTPFVNFPELSDHSGQVETVAEPLFYFRLLKYLPVW